MRSSDVHFPKDLTEALAILHSQPGMLIFSGGTDILREQGSRGISLPDDVLYVRDLPELRRAGLTERFLEIGAAVTVSELLELGNAALPPLLSEAAAGIGSSAIRNLATVGGNLACRSRFMDLWPVLACLETLVELRDQGGATWMNVNRFVSKDGRPSFPEGGILTRVRVPIEHWDVYLVRKVGLGDYPAPETALFSFAARAEKGILAELRIAFAGELAIRSQALEASIIGRSLPLSRRECAQFAESYRQLASTLSEGLALQFVALVGGAFDLLAR
jgi:CO/xanthine dehydrogenase FAD-binding subunit